MNFISTFDELNKLYEEAPKVVNKRADDLCAVMLDGQQKYTGTREECENWLKDKTGPLASRFKIVQGADVPVIAEALTEAAEDEEIEIVDNEAAAEEEPKQVICECGKCGALVIVDEADIVIDEESDLVNVEDECQFCEEAKGYKIIGVVAPYEVAEETNEEEVIETEDAETAEEASESPAVGNSDSEALSEYYDEECPQGRYTPYVSDPVKPWENSAPKWWKDRGGTEASWKNRPRTDYKHDEETGEYRPR
jgi:hypothetical protein